MKPHEVHRKRAERSLRVHVITVSTSRYLKMQEGQKFTDEAGDVAEKEITGAGNAVTRRALVSDDAKMIRKAVGRFLAGRDDVLVLTGGTGISSRDITIESVRPFFQKEVDGFGELLRRLSFDEIGTAAMLTRATMGVSKGKVILCLPGSPGAVKTALKSAVAELPHAVYIAKN